MSAQKNNFSMLEGMSIPIAISAIGIFVFVMNLELSSYKLFILLSNASFNIYLFHDFFNMIGRENLSVNMSVWKYIVILFVFVMGSSLITNWILQKFKKLLKSVDN